MHSLRKILLSLTRRSDITLAALLAAVIFLMILPMPTELVDVLIAVNMAAAVILLMLGIYIPTPLSFSAFPSVLLLSTLFRLALSITTTRLILLQADAGDIVYSFGNFVVAGNLVVGIVVFLIITIVQFVVITKGSERIAEVSARFSLDAMPGKQMSIDADLRAGIIDMQQALQRRNRLEQQSQLYGSMDGAMKFVKGDAIAGLCIIVVNIVGGISIGVFQQNMPLGEALKIYTTLTVGDGLVAQIPALFIAITAGIIVTRVSTEDSHENLGAEIGSQIIAHPNAILIGGVAAFGFAMLPGFPTITFLVIGFILGSVALTLKAADRERESASRLTSAVIDGQWESQWESNTLEDFKPVAPLSLSLSRNIEGQLDLHSVNDELANMRQKLYLDLGVPFPGVHLNYDDTLAPNGYSILLHGIEVASGRLKPNQLCLTSADDTLDILGIAYEEAEPLLNGQPNSNWIDAKHEQTLLNAGIPTMNTIQLLVFHLSFIARKNASEFIGLQETRSLMTHAERDFPELVKEALQVLPIQKMTDVLKRLIKESISIRDLRATLEAIVSCGQTEKDTALISEYVRARLSRQISHNFSDDRNMLAAYLLNPDIEEKIRKGIRQTPQGAFLAIEPAASRDLVNSIKKSTGNTSQQAQQPVLLTSIDIRRFVRKLLEADLSDLPVLSYQELTHDVTVQPLDRIGLMASASS